jgi:hypothetical protein
VNVCPGPMVIHPPLLTWVAYMYCSDLLIWKASACCSCIQGSDHGGIIFCEQRKQGIFPNATYYTYTVLQLHVLLTQNTFLRHLV